MKKILLTALIASVLIVPLGIGNTALADHEEAAVPIQVQEYLPGRSHDTNTLDLTDGALVWEGLYNMLSLYGQMDSRADSDNGELFLPEETVQDYAASLDVEIDSLSPMPADLRDRINYDNVSRCYVIFRGEDDQAQLQTDSIQAAADGLVLTGGLVYVVDGQVLTQFRAVLQRQDNMFGFSIRSLTITG